MPAIEVTGLSKAYGSLAALRGVDFTVAARRGVRPARPQRRRKDDRASRCSRATGTATAARSACSGATPGPLASCASRVGIVLQSCGTYPHLTVRETVEHWAGAVPAPRDVRRGARARGARRLRRPPRADAERRPGAAAGLRAGAGRRPGADLPRRADDGLRPGGPPRRLGRHPRAARPRQDRRADHALPGRGAGAGRPRRDPPGRADPGRGPAGRARAPRATASPGAPADGTLEERFTEDPTALLHDAHRRGAGPRRAAGGPERHPAEPRGRLPGADGGRARDGRAVPWWGAAWRQYRLERRMFWRNPTAAFFGVLLPLGLLAIFGAVFAGQRGGPRRDRARHRRR